MDDVRKASIAIRDAYIEGTLCASECYELWDALDRALDAPDPVAAAVAGERSAIENVLRERAEYLRQRDKSSLGVREIDDYAAGECDDLANVVRARATPAPACDTCGDARSVPIVEPDGSVDRDRVCPACEGSGFSGYGPGYGYVCSECGGTQSVEAPAPAGKVPT